MSTSRVGLKSEHFFIPVKTSSVVELQSISLSNVTVD